MADLRHRIGLALDMQEAHAVSHLEMDGAPEANCAFFTRWSA
jgi:hypothetical protein